MKYCTCYVSLFNNVVHIFVSYISDDRLIYSSSSTIFSLFVIKVDPIFKLRLLEMKKCYSFVISNEKVRPLSEID